MTTSQVILVTGSSSGFGRLTVETLARQGYTVFAGLRASEGRNRAAADALRTLAAQEGFSLQVVDLDVADESSVDQAVASVVGAADRLDVVVNNAGVAYLGPIEAFTDAQALLQFDVNVLGVLRVNRAALPQMRAQGSGLLLQVGSVLGRLAYPFTGLYAATKFALEGLTEGYRLELAGLGIDAVIVEPGSYPTSLSANGTTPDDAARVVPYAAFLGEMNALATAANTGLDGPAPDPQEVADAIAALIARPAGTRPLRTVVVPAWQGDGPAALNAMSDATIAAAIQAIGFTERTRLAERLPVRS